MSPSAGDSGDENNQTQCRFRTGFWGRLDSLRESWWDSRGLWWRAPHHSDPPAGGRLHGDSLYYFCTFSVSLKLVQNRT